MRTVLISGARRGIGAALAKRLLCERHNVSIGVRDGALPGWAGNAALSQHIERLHLFDYDALDVTGEERWVAEVRKRFGSLDTIVANAGIMIAKLVIEADDEDVQAMFDVNVQAPRRLAKAAWDLLAQNGNGRVIILSSLSGKRVKSAKSGSYALTKFAATALAHSIRHAGFDLGIRATAVCPGFVATDMALGLTDHGAEQMTDPDDLARIISLLISLPNKASVAEFAVNCQIEESF
ncbi:SDR family NAD(P)-dependent oxidoreductase [Aliihoeflea sp. PC F10.4]